MFRFPLGSKTPAEEPLPANTQSPALPPDSSATPAANVESRNTKTNGSRCSVARA